MAGKNTLRIDREQFAHVLGTHVEAYRSLTAAHFDPRGSLFRIHFISRRTPYGVDRTCHIVSGSGCYHRRYQASVSSWACPQRIDQNGTRRSR